MIIVEKTDYQTTALGVAFFATGPGLGLIIYIFTTLEFPTHNLIITFTLMKLTFSQSNILAVSNSRYS